MTADYLDRITFGNAEPPARSSQGRKTSPAVVFLADPFTFGHVRSTPWLSIIGTHGRVREDECGRKLGVWRDLSDPNSGRHACVVLQSPVQCNM